MPSSPTELGILPPHLQALVTAELQEGEAILWLGQPNPRRFAWQSLPIVLFAIPVTALAACWVFPAAGLGMPQLNQGANLFRLMGLPFVLIGLGMFGAPFWMMRQARRTAYLVTNRRALLFDGRFSATMIRSLERDRLTNLYRMQRADGTGNLIFGHPLPLLDEDGQTIKDDWSRNIRPTTLPDAFLDIPQVQEVEDLVRRIAETGPECLNPPLQRRSVDEQA